MDNNALYHHLCINQFNNTMKRILILLASITFGTAVYSQTTDGDGVPVELTIIQDGHHTTIKRVPLQMPCVYLNHHSLSIYYVQENPLFTALQIYNDRGEVIYVTTNLTSSVWTIPLTEELWQEMYYIHLVIDNRVFFGMV